MTGDDIVTQGKEIADLKAQLRNKSKPFESALHEFVKLYTDHVDKISEEFRKIVNMETETEYSSHAFKRKFVSYMMGTFPFQDDAKFELDTVDEDSATFIVTSNVAPKSFYSAKHAWLTDDVRTDEVIKLVRENIEDYVSSTGENAEISLNYAQSHVEEWEAKNASRRFKKKKVPEEILGKQKRIEFLKAIKVVGDNLTQYIEKEYAQPKAE